MNIIEALKELDQLDDDHWTNDGLPKTDVVSDLVGEKVTRKEITEAAPHFTRENAEFVEIDTTDEELNSDDEDTPDPGDEAESTDEEPVDASPLFEFVEKEPMETNKFIEFARNLDPRLLVELESILISQLSAIDSKISEVEEFRRLTKMNKSIVQTYIKQSVPDMSNQEAIQQYIRSSNERRAEKHKEIRELLGDITMKDLSRLDPRSALDKALAKKR